MARKARKGVTVGRKPKKEAAEKPPENKAFPLIGRNDLNRLLEQVAIFQNRANSASGSMAELIGDYVKKKHLHAGAFRIINRWRRLGERDPQALWLELAHVDDMRQKANLDRLAEAQGQLLPPIGEEEDQAPGENVVDIPIPREVEEQAGAA